MRRTEQRPEAPRKARARPRGADFQTTGRAAGKRRERLRFTTRKDKLTAHWCGRRLMFPYHADVPIYVPLLYEIAYVSEGRAAPDSPIGRAMKNFLGSDCAQAMRDPEVWMRDRLPTDIDAWTLRQPGETGGEWLLRMLLRANPGR